MRRFFALALVAALIGLGLPTNTFAAAKPQNGQISGAAKNQGGQPLANHTVRLRNVGSGQIAGTATTSAGGQFTFTNLAAGNYVIEVVDAAGQVVATSTTLTLSAATMTLTGVAVTASAAGVAAAAGAAAGGSFFTSTAGIVLLVAAGGGAVAAVVATRGDESPKK